MIKLKHHYLHLSWIFVLVVGTIFFLNQKGITLAAGEINSGNITQAPYSCSTGATTCNLSNKEITSIAPNTFINHTNLNNLNLSYNNISSIESGSFNGLSNLTKLYFNHNQISSIESGSFNGLSNLTDLQLHYNQISSIESNSFNGLSNLINLYLYGNQITSIESGAFNGLSDLNWLDLNYNNISSISEGDFNGLSSLTFLDIEFNQISSIESNSFNGLSNLTKLYLSSNQISSIEIGDFNGLSNLKGLSFSYNQISSIESGSFNVFSNLTNLELHYNQISSIEIGDFNGLSNLKGLNIAYNKISSVEIGSFNSISNLTNLVLSYNQISSIESGHFSGLSQLNYVGFGSSCNTNGYEDIEYRYGKWTYTDNEYCVLITGTDAGNFITSLESRGYTFTGNYYRGNYAISFNHIDGINKFLTPVIMESNNLNGYSQDYYQNIVQVQYESGTEIIYNSTAFSGILHSPELFSTGSVTSITGIIAITRFGYLLGSVDFSQPVTVRMPALGKAVDDIVNIYSSDAENIYSEDPDWNFEQTGTVIDIDGDSYVEFTTDHASWFALGEIEGNLKSYFDGYEDSSSGSWLNVKFNQFNFGDAWKSIIDIGTTYSLIIKIKNTLGRSTTSTDIIPVPGGYRYHLTDSLTNNETGSVQLKIKYFNK